MIRSGSSLADEDRIIPLDLTNVKGDMLMVRLNPPRGFWKFDYVAVSYEFDRALGAVELAAKRAEDENGGDLRDVLKGNDERYYVQQKHNAMAKIWFDVPQQAQGSSRDLFLKASGYYIIHTDTTRPPQTNVLRQLTAADNAAVEYALDEYVRWINTPITSR